MDFSGSITSSDLKTKLSILICSLSRPMPLTKRLKAKLENNLRLPLVPLPVPVFVPVPFVLVPFVPELFLEALRMIRAATAMTITTKKTMVAMGEAEELPFQIENHLQIPVTEITEKYLSPSFINLYFRIAAFF